ncbi:serine protease 7-like isoform X2 [Photinus pyralis]|uniref:serine protease 7-like isoform X2 n=1 Tax=Photinus pyralis TaxID=7054 RepID=UPI001267210B|nr:serine protease 7-like isoform X2 [Photinus pyralis]XP_031354802.1 serine protease 7-like isoform X2 [Photinus pyralis]
MMDKRAIFQVIVLLNVAVTSRDLLPSRAYCGYQHIDDYTRDSDDVTIDEFPWMAQIVYDTGTMRVQCSGSLINNRYVLTAAHCLSSQYAKVVGVQLGDFNATSTVDCIYHTVFGEECSDPVQTFEIEEEILHPKYNPIISELHDIGLIRLSRTVEYSEYIRAICLPATNASQLNVGDQLAISGWGLLGNEEKQTQVKKKIKATLVPTRTCQETYTKFGRRFLTDDHLCALDQGKRTCRGDSGAPLMLAVRKQWEQVGVLSFGKCEDGFPSGYIKVTSYLEWIIENLRL